MRHLRSAVLATTLATLTFVVSAGATAVSWMPARQTLLPRGATGVPNGYLPTLACVSAGNCVAGGSYSNARGNTEGLILTERNNSWIAPFTLRPPAGAAVNAGLTIYALSCGSLGNCAAVGSYQDRASDVEGFVANDVNGRWLRASEVALPANALGAGQNAAVHSVACSSRDNCSAVGSYLDSATPTSRNVAFTLTQVNGTWRRASEISLPASTNFNPFVTISQVGCTSAGNCVAVGSYIDANDVSQGLLTTQSHGVWSAAVAPLLPVNASAYAGAALSEVTCVARSTCSALGTYYTSTGTVQGLDVGEARGRWLRASELTMPPNAAPNPHVFLYGFQGIACSSPGNCSVGGQYQTTKGAYEGFFANQIHGAWRRATELVLPLGGVSAGKNGGVVTLSCPSAGNCRAGAAYLDDSSNYQGLVVAELNGVWQRGTKIVLPTGATTVGIDGGVYAVVCATADSCTATGSYLKGATTYEGFTLSS